MCRLLVLSAFVLAVAAFLPVSSAGFFRHDLYGPVDAANDLVGGEELSSDDALYLTPYIDAGKLKEGRELSEVKNLPKNVTIKSFSGFLTVNKKYNSNIFFWFFPALVSAA